MDNGGSWKPGYSRVRALYRAVQSSAYDREDADPYSYYPYTYGVCTAVYSWMAAKEAAHQLYHISTRHRSSTRLLAGESLMCLSRTTVRVYLVYRSTVIALFPFS